MIDGYYAIDYQVHSFRSHDGRATIIDHCERAVQLGLDEIGFSEHLDFDPDDPAVGHFDYDRYVSEIFEARDRFADSLTIRMGIEVDYQKWFEDEIAEYLATHSFDFVIGSVHYVDRVMIMTPEYVNGRSSGQAYDLYFAAVLDSVQSGLIDIVGHLEYAKRRGVPVFGPFDPTRNHDTVMALFGEMIGRGVALEINTAGLRQNAGGPYPCPEHVRMYASLGGRLLTIGSDAHHPDDLAAEYSHAANLALESGLTELTTWESRRSVQRSFRAA